MAVRKDGQRVTFACTQTEKLRIVHTDRHGTVTGWRTEAPKPSTAQLL